MSRHRPRKRFGQNFLHDPGVIQHIVQSIAPRPGEHLVEIGPGQGALTGPLLAACGQLEVVELDRDLIPVLEACGAGAGELTIHHADALRVDFCALRHTGEQLRLVGNLPYNISTPLLFHLMSQLACIRDMHFMLQKEVVDRIVAPPGSKAYGRLGVMLGYYCQAEQLFLVRPGAFTPAPKVDSAIVRLIPHTVPPVQVNDIKQLDWLVNRLFSQRRKMVRHSLKDYLDEIRLRELGIEPTERPEQLDLSAFARLANAL
ncbi:16S rRNA (adenine(1518)-N(6)/adenine(1519)-N(6))-dimethyltransferase RsmA [Thiohalophilus thiocyanatoxydans]|uniref:Ribosomal RNA small subunit methyltransferase A n=1 Tax=Thiohalophilus thiocyanatoxydans TaxID=381308 RepID=A0A4R8IXK7_9GAMM|nr:16S rRNA (adenine(1518)-N(6)/adenine(1519)-N(6))-dimethyltransferase RsmA [Thiohalophilus thiocyanatoxydans]TDY04320.1 dimethyladenosine transferase [Thiohalophilus thiocyanatoxydans]